MAALALTLWIVFAELFCACYGKQEQGLSRHSFPPGFIFGVSGSSYQYEGAVREDGRGPSTWDTFCHTPGKISDGSNGDVATDSYHRYKEDVRLVKELGMDSYRFSISWSRILPYGTIRGGINRRGIQFYNDLINEIVKHGIKPIATLFHFDVPQALEDSYKGFLSPQIIDDFKEYAELCFIEFGDRVKQWVTMNEPVNFATEAYDEGRYAPGRCSRFKSANCTAGDSGVEPYLVVHHMLLAHSAAVDIYRRKFQSNRITIIGIVFDVQGAVPYSHSPSDINAASRAVDFQFGWCMNPLMEGDYPEIMHDLVGSRLPRFTAKEKKLLKGSFDFIGINYYTSSYVSAISMKPNPGELSYSTDALAKCSSKRNGVPIGQPGTSTWIYSYPQGLQDLLNYTKNKYRNPPIYITENGIDEANVKDLPLERALNDRIRIKYHAEHLEAVRGALREGSDVRGYFTWSLLDNFEWNSGYTARYGLYYVDFNNGSLNRYPKASVAWFRNFLCPAPLHDLY